MEGASSSQGGGSMKTSHKQPLRHATAHYANSAWNAPKPPVVVAPRPYDSADVRQDGDF